MHQELEEAKEKFEANDYAGTVELLKTFIQTHGKHPQAYYLRGQAHRKLGDYQSSLSDFDTLVIIEPNAADSYAERGVTHFHLKNFENCMNDLNKALELEPNNAYRYSSRAYIKGYSGDIEGAIEDYKKAIELDPEDEIAHNNLGLMQEKLGYRKQSHASFKRSNEILKEKYGIEVNEEIRIEHSEIKKVETEKTAPIAPSENKTVSDIFKSFFSDSEARKDFVRYWKRKLGK